MKRSPLFVVLLLLGGFLVSGAGCASDPNVEGAKLDLRNKDYDRALENLEEALARDPQNAEAYELKGQVLQEQLGTVNDPDVYAQKVREMLDAYSRATEINAELGEGIDQRLRMAYYNTFNKGIQAFNRGREDQEVYNEAADYFGLAGELQPDSADAFVNKGYALLNAGRQEEAIEPFETAISLGDSEPQTYIFLSDLYRAANRSEDQVTTLEQARELYPEDPDIQAQLLNAYIAADMTDRALATYQGAVEREPDNKLYRYNYGSLLLEMGRYEEAVEHLRRAAELDPEYANAYYNLGAAYINQAVDVSDQINALDDRLRENRNDLSAAEIQQMEAEIEEMTDRRRALFSEAVTPLETAKSLVEASGEEAGEICRALFSAYVQTGQQEQAESIAACAGYEDIN